MLLAVIMLCSCLSVCSLASGKYHYVVLGDSIAYGSGLVNAREACYGKMVADTCGFDYANHAVPGATSLELIVGIVFQILAHQDPERTAQQQQRHHQDQDRRRDMPGKGGSHDLHHLELTTQIACLTVLSNMIFPHLSPLKDSDFTIAVVFSNVKFLLSQK